MVRDLLLMVALGTVGNSVCIFMVACVVAAGGLREKNKNIDGEG